MFKWITIAAFLVYFGYTTWLNILRTKSRNIAIPDNLSDVYDEETYKKWKEYDNERNKLNLLSHFVSAVVALALLAFNVYAFAAGLFGETNVYAATVIVTVFDILVTTVVDLPFAYYSTFSIEQRYGFNKSTRKLFFTDELKNLIIELVLMNGLLCLFIFLHQLLGAYIILVFTGVMGVFLLILFVFSPLFQKIFNKFTLLEDGDLKNRLTSLMEENGCHVKAIKVVDGSRRSSRANAYFTGIGSMKTIVLYDTLLTLLTEDEIVAVFAHEVGHNKHKDTIKGYIMSVLNIVLIVCAAFGLVSFPELLKPFGFAYLNYGMAFIVLGIFINLLNPFMGLAEAYFSCKHEYAADRFAVENGYGEALITALKKLSRDSLSNLTPHPIVVKLTYSHPPLSARIAAIEKAAGEPVGKQGDNI